MKHNEMIFFRLFSVILLFTGLPKTSNGKSVNYAGNTTNNVTEDDSSTIRKVHIVFMTHLDVGYTASTIREVLQIYAKDHFPAAFRTSQILRDRGGEERFVYTSHAWLIDALLRNQSGALPSNTSAVLFVSQLKEAIHRGDVTWHASPFNLQQEASNVFHMDFAHGFAHCALDDKFQKKRKIAASQKDTPGFTRGMTKLLNKHGIQMMHIGVNDFSTPPSFPYSSPPFHGPCHVGLVAQHDVDDDDDNQLILTSADQQPLLLLYCSGYSASFQAGKEIPVMITTVPYFDEALVFFMHVDNSRPQTLEQVLEGWRYTQSMFPNAKLKASSLDEWTESFFRAYYNPTTTTTTRPRVPIVNSNHFELGDTWIYGISSDPTKMRWYRAILREVHNWSIEQDVFTHTYNENKLMSSSSTTKRRKLETDLFLFYNLLLKVPEHTWGSNGAGCNSNFSNTEWNDPAFSCVYGGDIYETTKNSWLDHRNFIPQAVDSLNDETFKERLRKAIADREPPSATDIHHAFHDNRLDVFHVEQTLHYTSHDNTSTFATLQFNQSGTITHLAIGNTTFCSLDVSEPNAKPHFLGALTYRTHSEEELNQFGDKYCLSNCVDNCGRCGFSKCNMGGHSSYNTAFLVGDARRRRVNSTYDEFWFNTTFYSENQTTICQTYGAPAYNVIRVGIDTSELHRSILSIHYDITWYQKPPTRMAESIWFSFSPKTKPTTSKHDAGSWKIHKLGEWIDPFQVATNGSASAHAIWEGIRYHASDMTIEINSPDAPLVSPNLDLFPPGKFNAAPRPDEGWAFDLFNNAWNTNYPLWSLQESERFQLSVVLKGHP